MALTEAQRVSIRFYLGWSARFHQFDSRLEQAMNAIDSMPTLDTQTKIESLITDLDSLITKLKESYTRLKAMKLGSIVLPGQNEVALLRSEGRRNAEGLAAILGVEVRQNVFGAGGVRNNLMPQG